MAASPIKTRTYSDEANPFRSLRRLTQGLPATAVPQGAETLKRTDAGGTGSEVTGRPQSIPGSD